ncbi:YdcF family protein [Roseiconus lacunae]|uniref:YdcF family protein n=1 Tax=Roseiconus lacunae TaxID=2605694 RepID=UPI001E64A273|nr:ElyC/SanA/YdcF family protein [Roseiconus lacunae]MCD0458857.1 YdcF family protein [Roseiconus lacunae]
MDTNDMTLSNHANRWRRRFWAMGAVFVVTMIALSFASVRGLVMQPLVVHHSDARGEIAYVMADGPAYWERLFAASDLYHFGRIKSIYLLEERQSSSHNFERGTNDTRLQRAIDYLDMRGVPASAIVPVPMGEPSWLSSRDEAKWLAQMNQSLEGIVVVTSPPHTRRSLLCFRRVFSNQTPIAVYSATSPDSSVETHLPLWIEYVKLVAYWIAA